MRSVFQLYLAGRSTKEIARRLDAAETPPPRASADTRHKHRPMWAKSSIAAMLANERYAGTWRFGERVWIKAPGTGRRVARPALPDQVVTQERPDFAIVTRETWDAAAERRAAVKATYTRTETGEPTGSTRADPSSCRS